MGEKSSKSNAHLYRINEYSCLKHINLMLLFLIALLQQTNNMVKLLFDLQVKYLPIEANCLFNWDYFTFFAVIKSNM